MQDLMRIIKRYAIPIFYGAIERAGFRSFMEKLYILSVYKKSGLREVESHDGFVHALQDCILRVDSYVHTVFPDKQILWIHDKGKYDQHAKLNLDMIRNLSRSDLWKDLVRGSQGIDPAEYSHVVDTIYFGDSAESRAIQLADACCATITRHLQGDPVAKPFYDIIGSQIVNDGAPPAFEKADKTIEEMLRKYSR